MRALAGRGGVGGGKGTLGQQQGEASCGLRSFWKLLLDVCGAWVLELDPTMQGRWFILLAVDFWMSLCTDTSFF